MKYKNIVIAGGGILGSQIAYQSAYSGFNVIILIREEDSKKDVNDKLENLYNRYIKTIKLMKKNGEKDTDNWARGIAGEKFEPEKALSKASEALKNIRIETNMEKALQDADLLIESITENFDIKANFYREAAKCLPRKTVIVTNSSTLLPSKLSKYTQRQEKFLSLHFANEIWKNNIAEIMRHDQTNNKYFNEVTQFAEAINMIPLAAKEEKSGYILNSMLVPFLLSSMDLLANGVADPETIDKAWKLGTGAPDGPFEILDIVGLETAKNIVMQYQKVPDLFDPLLKKMMLPYNYDGMLEILNKYIKKGKTGKAAKEGFYKYK